ncbi:MAG: hypothetical protein LC112_07655 [Flavobacteriales bacterium]|nr:hypothetical protein [Flavobacteriales bacterium]
MNAREELKQLFADRNPVMVGIEISGYTGFRTTLIDELTDEEAKRLLEAHAPKPADLDKEYNALKEDFIKREWKSAVLAMAEKTNIKEKGSFAKFNNWMIASSRFKKHLNAHTIDELKLVHQQLKAVQQNNARSATRPMTKAWWNKAEQLKKYN